MILSGQTRRKKQQQKKKNLICMTSAHSVSDVKHLRNSTPADINDMLTSSIYRQGQEHLQVTPVFFIFTARGYFYFRFYF